MDASSTASKMRFTVTPIRPESGNKVFSILRVFLWLMPAIFIPIWIFITAKLSDLFNGNNASPALGFFILGLTISTAAVGYLDRRIDLMEKKIAPPHSKTDLVRCTIIFVLAQIVIAPTFCFAIFFGYLFFSRSL